MQCPACGSVNSPGRIYCGGCARAIGESCTVCFFVNESGNRFCGGCARDLLAAANAPAEPVRAAAIGSTAPPAAEAPGKPPASPFAGGGQGDLLSDLQDLDDLFPGKPAAACGESGPTTDGDATQSAVDGFFQRLAREGVAEIDPPAASGQVPGSSRSVPE